MLKSQRIDKRIYIYNILFSVLIDVQFLYKMDSANPSEKNDFVKLVSIC